jgi:hypothetical protein
MELGVVSLLRSISKKVASRSYNYFPKFICFDSFEKKISLTMSKLHDFVKNNTRDFRD